MTFALFRVAQEALTNVIKHSSAGRAWARLCFGPREVTLRAVVRSGLRMLLEHEADIEIVGEAGAARETLEQVARLQPDLVLMDIGLALAAGD
jgi:hypothetical protein